MNNRSVVAALLAFLAMCIFLLAIFDAIGPLGRHIPQEDLTSDYFLGVLWAMGLGLSIYMWPVKPTEKGNLLVAWTARCVVTLVLMLFYEYFFDTDSFGYFYYSAFPEIWDWDGLVLGRGTQNLARLAGLHTQILPHSFHMMKVSFSMVGFIATYICYRAAVLFLGREDVRVFYAFSLFPSIVFWSSIIGKDPITLLGIAIYLYGVASWFRESSVRSICIILVGIWGAMTLRIWLGPILLAPLAIFVITRMRNKVMKALFCMLILGAFLFAAGRMQGQFHIESSQDLVATIDSRAHSTGWDGATGRQTGASFTNIGQLLAFIPIGAFTALFRPLPGELLSAFGVLAGTENLLLLVLLFQAVRRTRISELKDPRLMWALMLILFWSSLYGFISYQNLGAAVRFRLQILPVLLATLLYLRRERRAVSA